jgi:hypothetical protein
VSFVLVLAVVTGAQRAGSGLRLIGAVLRRY